ncbi:uncharacterized protein N7484_002432 [Penicillium longicatenatum]|uniref:uncharacterized protein n=1 Tax=Penicillium longicatenatum TaxID=1561947 RepID=UPI00254876C0|nr:uncharacterized protein N7484_002432 [Penicillium longicatenatum]KAJ5658783.1 hypothetical protein N7484_002432 [Penicillium longicatenatum]
MYILPWALSLVAVSSAAPTNFFDDVYDFSEELLGYYSAVSQKINQIRHTSEPSAVQCDTSKISLPSYASGLPSPTGLTPMYVALGRGTQNYTCADSTSSSAPTAIGAVANLYNATCLAASYAEVLAMLPTVAYKIALPTKEYATFPPANLELMGHHFFYDSTTPEFNLDTTTAKQYGIAMTNKIDSIDAPTSATKGQNGAVSWLYLKTVSGTVGNYKAVYRVDTASGSPPTTCKGMKSSFEIQYAALYYFYG